MGLSPVRNLQAILPKSVKPSPGLPMPVSKSTQGRGVIKLSNHPLEVSHHVPFLGSLGREEEISQTMKRRHILSVKKNGFLSYRNFVLKVFVVVLVFLLVHPLV
jgi:hypothetical protein